MNTNLETNFLYKILRFSLYAALLTPLWVWSIFLFPFITTKILYFRLLIEFASVIYIILAFRFPEIRPKFNWLNRTILIYLAVIIITSLLGLNFYRSFWGNIERGEGLVSILHFVAYFIILSASLRSFRDWQKYLLFALVVVLLSGFYSLAQLFNLSFVVLAGATRTIGTVGNASFFAGYVMLGVMLSLYLLKNETRLAMRWFLGSAAIFLTIILYLTQTRGALIASVVALFLYFLFTIFRAKSRLVKIGSLGLLVVVLLVPFLIYANRHSEFIRTHGTLNRLASISPSDITTQSRLDTWQASWRGWKDRFFLGYGYENYNLAFNKYFPARIFKDQGSQIWFDRAHDIVFDIGVTSGIFGLVSYFSIFAAAFYFLFKMRHQLPGALILGLGLVAYFLQNLFVFDTHATYLMFYMLVAHITWNYNQNKIPKTQEAETWSYSPGFIAIGILAIVLIFVAYQVNLKPSVANRQSILAARTAQLKQYRDVKALFVKALSHHTYMDDEIRQRLVDYANEAAASGQLSSEEQSELYKYVVAELEKSIKAAPEDVRNYLYLMAELNRAVQFNSTFVDEAIFLGQKALKLSPTRPQTYFELGQAYYFKKDYETGIRQFQKAVELSPEPKESHFNYLLAAVIAGREDLVAEQQKAIVELGYALGAQEYLAIGRAYLQVPNKQKGIESFTEALKLQPNSYEIHARLATVYADICDVEHARIEALETVRLNSSYQNEATEFLRQTQEKCKK